MNTLQKVLMASVLAAPIVGVGCAKNENQETTKAVANTPKKAVTSALYSEITNLIPAEHKTYMADLKKYKTQVPGIHLFDEGKRGYLTKDDVEKYIRVMIANRKEGDLTKEEINKLDSIIAKLEDSSKVWITMREWDREPTIETTLNNFRNARASYQKLLDGNDDNEIKARMERLYPSNKK